MKEVMSKTASLALKTPTSAPLSALSGAGAMPSLSLGLTAVPPPLNNSSQAGRVAQINVMPVSASTSQQSTIKSIQEQLKRLSELNNLNGFGTEEIDSLSSDKGPKSVAVAN